MCPVINHLAGTGYCSRFEEIDSQTVASVNDMIGLYSVFMEIHLATSGYIVLGQAGYEFRFHTVIGQ